MNPDYSTPNSFKGVPENRVNSHERHLVSIPAGERADLVDTAANWASQNFPRKLQGPVQRIGNVSFMPGVDVSEQMVAQQPQPQPVRLVEQDSLISDELEYARDTGEPYVEPEHDELSQRRGLKRLMGLPFGIQKPIDTDDGLATVTSLDERRARATTDNEVGFSANSAQPSELDVFVTALEQPVYNYDPSVRTPEQLTSADEARAKAEKAFQEIREADELARRRALSQQRPAQQQPQQPYGQMERAA
jgi:hypothetical protein